MKKIICFSLLTLIFFACKNDESSQKNSIPEKLNKDIDVQSKKK